MEAYRAHFKENASPKHPQQLIQHCGNGFGAGAVEVSLRATDPFVAEVILSERDII